MGGQVLDYEAKRIRDKARAEGVSIGEARGKVIGEAIGEARGEARGEDIRIIKQVNIKVRKGQKPEVIADALEENLLRIHKICASIREAGSEFNAEEVYQILLKMEQKNEEPEG